MRTPQPELPGQAPDPLASPPVLPLLPVFPRRHDRRRPLPDSFAVHRIPLPAAVPPYDDRDRPDGRAADPLPAGAGPRDRAVPGPGRPPLPVPGWPAAVPLSAAGPQWPSQFAQALAETLAGSRPSRQITSWTTEQARRRIRQLGPALRAQQRPLVRRVLTSEPEPGVVEMTVIVTVGGRTRALAVRLERTRPGRERPGRDPGRPPEWLCTAIEAA
jgi:Family of unknown function (DUF6459)